MIAFQAPAALIASMLLASCATTYRSSSPEIEWQGRDRRIIRLSRDNLTRCHDTMFGGSNCDRTGTVEISRERPGIFALDQEYRLELEGIYRIKGVCFCADQPVIKLVHVVGLYNEQEPIGVLEYSSGRAKALGCATPTHSWACQGWHSIPARTVAERRAIDRRLESCDCHDVPPPKAAASPWSAARAADLRWVHGAPRSRTALRGAHAPKDRRDWSAYQLDLAQPQYCYEVTLLASPELQGRPLVIEWDMRTRRIRSPGGDPGAEAVAECLRSYRWTPATKLKLDELRIHAREPDLQVLLELSHGDIP